MKSYDIIGRTDKGQVRAANEDHILVARMIKNRGGVRLRLEADDDFSDTYGLILAVADGVGGEAGGALASRLGLTVFDREFYKSVKMGLRFEEISELLRLAVSKANEALLREAERQPRFAHMGATLAGVCLFQGRYFVFNAGDSRVYRQRGGFLKQLTRDDTLVAQAVRAGAMTTAEAEASPDRHTITNCLGSVNLTLSLEEGPALRPGDSLLICSDGLHDLVDQERLEKIMAGGDLEEVMAALFHEAEAAGGLDNISVIMMRTS
ncbi:MAG: PP2C family serine/threonine-protein phosphatase [Thermodesulfobacteriota bacterium]